MLQRLLLALIFIGAALGAASGGAPAWAQAPSDLWRDAMARLQPLAGAYVVTGERFDGEKWSEEPENRSEAEYILDGAALRDETGIRLGGVDGLLMTTFGWDAGREMYRAAVIDSIYGFPDIYEGGFDSAGRLVLDNLRTDTAFITPNSHTNFRLTFEFSESGHGLTIDVTGDGGDTWSPGWRYDYRRSE
ncbi:MAG: hypothetical protein Tsb0010_09370 [Parvularculaceae bacterium]